MANILDDLDDDFGNTFEPEADDIDSEEEQRAQYELKSLLKREADEEDNEFIKPKKKVKAGDDANHFAKNLNKIRVHTLETVDSCHHEVAIPPEQDYIPLEPRTEEPSKTYPFVLDPFQKQAILCIDNNQSVLASAHTSAGKTVVGEYAIAMCLKNKQRVIYTTPIKALSNQKYRDFTEEFSDVGLLTGDATINPNASCLIMTTEILRSMLYRGSEVTREIGWVIFDEIHYMRDRERGYVWEESLILLPPTVKFAFLSATIPNAIMFAQWICYLHHQPCHVVYTDYRPVPLQHYLYPTGGEGVFLVVDQSKFSENNFGTAMKVMEKSVKDMKLPSDGKKGSGKDGNELMKLVKMIMERNFAPAVVFSFSKKECEFYATSVMKLDFNMAKEKEMVEEVFMNAIDLLSEEDRQLPQVQTVLPLLKRGIGIHHGGLLPILKETIEILFAEGLLKVLFATETFAMGLNMPARTVMFTSIQKFDGKEMRYLTSGEYIQMSGRAGRRGKDEKGLVIMKVDETMNKEIAKKLFEGEADPINSAFHLTYNMVLNLMRVEGINPEFILERSFYQFQNLASIPKLRDEICALEQEIGNTPVTNEMSLRTFLKIKESLAVLYKERQVFITEQNNLIKFLQVGRLVSVRNDNDDFGWGVILSYNKKDQKDDAGESILIIDVLLHATRDSIGLKTAHELKPAGEDEKKEPIVVPIIWKLIWELSSVRIKVPSDLKPIEQRMLVMKMVDNALERVPEDQFKLDPIGHMKIKDPKLILTVKRIAELENKYDNHELKCDPDQEHLLDELKVKIEKEKKLDELQKKFNDAKGALQLNELKYRKKVLKRLGYTNENDAITQKGRVACEFSAADELLLTEMIFDGIFNDLTAEEACAILSTFVCDERAGDLPELSPKLQGILSQTQKIARKIARVCNECSLEIIEDDYVGQFKPFLMEVVYSWCEGMPFIEVCKMTTIFEGSIVRAMKRLEELLRQLVQASRAIGVDLEKKFNECIKLLKRDIVFAPSLYL